MHDDLPRTYIQTKFSTTKMSVNKHHYFEGADPIDLTKLESDYMKRLYQQRINTPNQVQNTVFVSPKIDGYRCILYHNIVVSLQTRTKQIAYDTNYYMITRRGERHELDPSKVPTSLASTPFIFDIEIVKEEFYNKYFIMDVLHLGDEMLQNRNFEYRLQKLNELIIDEGVVGEGRGFQFIKVPYEIYNPHKLLTDITNLTDVETDGVVFCFGKDCIRQSRKRFKLEDTIDFQILPLENSKTKVALGVLVNSQPLAGPSRIMNRNARGRGRGRSIQRVEIFAPFGQQQILRCKKGEFEINGIYEFKYNIPQRRFECVRRRHDKLKPNRVFVANFIFNEIIKKKHLINPFKIPLSLSFLKNLEKITSQNEEEEEKEDPDSSPEESPSSKPLSM